jgi:hypothetical protein
MVLLCVATFVGYLMCCDLTAAHLYDRLLCMVCSMAVLLWWWLAAICCCTVTGSIRKQTLLLGGSLGCCTTCFERLMVHIFG